MAAQQDKVNREDVLLSVRDLRTYFNTEDGLVKAVDGVNFHVRRGEILGIVGESGSGKSVTARSIMQLVPCPPGKIQGEIVFEGSDLLSKRPGEMRLMRGKEISMVFQEPMTSLNPAYTIGFQINESIRMHQGLSKKDGLAKAVEMLRLVGIPSPEKRIGEYPFQLSGGMRQRVMIAMALSCNPKLLIADEPTTALDVTIQAQILDLIVKSSSELGSSVILITHDLGVVAETAHRVVVMYAGQVVEVAPVKDLFRDPGHPYTQGLLLAIPRLDENKVRLNIIPGHSPNPSSFPQGCRFHPRCEARISNCSIEQPPLICKESGRWVRCWHTIK
ncbi:ABC transporter ATP-binding protein [Metallumcola ferriviriculae]|uniref:ABC transporter ATP-binding protein n=1 Tax=Metallumcola ferriviriculae TaxID=3039180 RepID=A0AAU0UK42_9FIRM|nr:ABC transporter ATP-binding protein [Desulfitibacteraceae bacterium MK1]